MLQGVKNKSLQGSITPGIGVVTGGTQRGVPPYNFSSANPKYCMVRQRYQLAKQIIRGMFVGIALNIFTFDRIY